MHFIPEKGNKMKNYSMKINTFVLMAAAVLTGCRNQTGGADAYGNFEATEVMVSSESAGRILTFTPTEGSDIEQGDIIALIDTTLFHLQKAEIDAAIRSIRTKIPTLESQNAILNQQIVNLNVNIARISNMLKEDAATQKQYDDLAGQVAVLQKQIAANNTQKASVAAEISVYETKKATLNEQISRCVVKSPVKGVVLEKFAEAGELTSPGKALVKVADLSLIKLKVYVSGAQLGNIKLRQNCTVRVDDGKKGFKTFTGIISYISGKAEFTPKIIQTKEERVTLVYAVTIEVKNDGTMKSGMPGEAIF